MTKTLSILEIERSDLNIIKAIYEIPHSYGESHGWRSLVGCSPWGHEDSDTY